MVLKVFGCTFAVLRSHHLCFECIKVDKSKKLNDDVEETWQN